MDKPNNPDNYITWWNDNFTNDNFTDERIGLSAKKLYSDVSTIVLSQFGRSNEFVKLISELHNYDAEYRHEYHYDLLMKKPEEIILIPKTWNNFISKVWRKNVVLNTNWDYENWDSEACKPDDGWISPSNWYDRIHDIVRTRIVVKYFDGVSILLEKMCNHFTNCGCQIEPDWKAREEGYYAAHLTVTREYDIPVGLQIQKKNISIEIQITTQIKDVITELTHKYYERKRETLEQSDIKWQWNYSSDEFLPNYIGHMLHYIEGELMHIREREI